VIGLVGCHPPPVPPSSLVYAIPNHTDKALAVVIAHDNADEHEPQSVPVEVVRRAMQASSFFSEEDTGELAQPIADALPQMTEEEYVRVVAWEANQPRYYYVYIRGGKLRMYFQRGSHVIEQHETTIPAATVALGPSPTPPAPPVDGPAPPPVDEPAPPPADGPAVGPAPVDPPAAGPAPAATPSSRPARPRSAVARRPAASGDRPPRLSEGQVRDKLRGLDQLRDRKLVSQVEYRQKRQEILNRL
jgi:hypothetical protein